MNRFILCLIIIALLFQPVFSAGYEINKSDRKFLESIAEKTFRWFRRTGSYRMPRRTVTAVFRLLVSGLPRSASRIRTAGFRANRLMTGHCLH